jgi:hypothetical protein
MIGWLLKKVASAPAQQPQANQAPAPERCALWHDVSRALDAKPKSATK